MEEGERGRWKTVIIYSGDYPSILRGDGLIYMVRVGPFIPCYI
jgi:hypothetical protein